MKKVNVFLAGVFFLLFSFGANAQTKTGADFFPGKWNLLVAGTPNGDIKMIVTLERKDGNLGGTIEIVDYENIKISKTDEKESSVTLYFNAEDHDLFILLDKKDENHVTGTEMDLFDVKGERIVKQETENANVQAQSGIAGEAYFIGKWNILAKGLPQGDTKMVIIIEKKEGKLTGNISDPASADGPMEFTSVTINDNALNAVFTAQGMDVPLNLTKKDDKNISGDVMGMFDIEGSRAN
jgi:hypothetical protein